MFKTFFSNIVQEEVSRHQKKLSNDAYLQAMGVGRAITERVLDKINSKILCTENNEFKNHVSMLFDL